MARRGEKGAEIGAGNENDFIAVFLKNGGELVVVCAALLGAEKAGVAKEKEEGRGLVDRFANGVGIKLGEDGDIKDVLGAAGISIEDDHAALG